MTAPSPLLSQTADQMRAQLAASPQAAAALIRAGADAGLPDAQAYYGCSTVRASLPIRPKPSASSASPLPRAM